ncbi:hypothetical protein B296_00010367 [Ensete ventricosum]|uniref:Uncharacterized protein n=1 Tax=Ensete ventricosum TaxID=4639 RepID=A0A426ZWW4_ENSVE|nr:hypothetical protein B296_00010367 [Ensete ventricosum]
MVTGGRLTNDQKKWDDHSPIRKACITREGWASSIPQISAVKRVTNWANDSSSFWLIPRRDAAVDFGRALAKKFSLNSLASWSNQKIEEGLRQLYYTWAGPRKVVGNAQHNKAPDLGNVRDDGLDHPGQSLHLVGDAKEGLGRDDGKPRVEHWRIESQVVEKSPVTIGSVCWQISFVGDEEGRQSSSSGFLLGDSGFFCELLGSECSCDIGPSF